MDVSKEEQLRLKKVEEVMKRLDQLKKGVRIHENAYERPTDLSKIRDGIKRIEGIVANGELFKNDAPK